MPSILRRRKSQQKVTRDSPLRPSLSLPDITSPLLDTATWEWDEVPDLVRSTAVTGAAATISTPPSAGRHRAPSLVRDRTNSPVQFHRPFTPWQVVDASSPLPKINPMMMGPGAGKGDFRDTNKWRASAVSSIARGADGKKRARGRGKVLESMNVVVAGGKGSGKTSFVKLLLDSFTVPAATHGGRLQLQNTQTIVKPPTPESTPASPTSPGPPVSAGLASITEHLPAPHDVMTDGPTKRLTSSVVDAVVDGHEAVKLRLIDTPGLNLSSDLVASRARERGVSGLLRLMEERFEETLKEESRIIRTRKRQEDGMLHLVLYLIDARSVLHPPTAEDEDEDVDWTSFGLFDDKPASASAPVSSRADPGLDITEIAVIRRLATRGNVLPVLTHMNALTTSQLETVRQVVRRDLAKVFGDELGKGFGIIGTMLEDEHRSETPDLSSSSDSDERPITPESLNGPTSTLLSPALPFAIFSPEPATTHEHGTMTRTYPWGSANVMDSRHGDFVALRHAVLGTFASALRTHTKEMLYESYRTERLLAQKERTQKA